MDTLRESLLAGAAQLELELEADTAERLLIFLRELLNWNRRINLTAITDPEQALSHHVLDSLAVAPHVDAAPLLDVGSGGGLPGIVLAILRPDLTVYSVDSRHKKISFQRDVARKLGLANVLASSARIEDWQAPAPMTQIISRAFASLADFIALAGGQLAEGGRLLAMKGRVPEEELARMPSGWRLVTMPRLRVPGLDAERHLLILERDVPVELMRP